MYGNVVTSFKENDRVVWNVKLPHSLQKSLRDKYGAGPFPVLYTQTLERKCTCGVGLHTHPGLHRLGCLYKIWDAAGSNQLLLIDGRGDGDLLASRWFQLDN